ncbi:hypothetical protein BC831DRAFT_490161 [Entophlyctis helioformis]|nr:hypothetical protein BC831DRAFT_490161 [Entophlyctis helioformis]
MPISTAATRTSPARCARSASSGSHTRTAPTCDATSAQHARPSTTETCLEPPTSGWSHWGICSMDNGLST